MPDPVDVYLRWRGRISRKTYWVFGMLPAALYLIDEFLLVGFNPSVTWPVLLAILLTSMMINIKRSHDLGRSGWFSLLLFVPLINLWPMYELGFVPGEDEGNRFGQPALW